MAAFIYDKVVLETFLEKQGQLFDEPVAENLEEADDFLDMMMATVVESAEEVAEYFEEAGMDAEGDILDACEVFEIPDGRYLIVEG